jgi:hypothetical protein
MNFIIRIIWFLFLGWWLALVWVVFAILACLTIIGLPVGLWMFSKTWAIATLAENPNDLLKNVSQQVSQQVTVINNSSDSSKKESPLVSLKRKYADGEITKEEFLERKSVLMDEDEPMKVKSKSKKLSSKEKELEE